MHKTTLPLTKAPHQPFFPKRNLILFIPESTHQWKQKPNLNMKTLPTNTPLCSLTINDNQSQTVTNRAWPTKDASYVVIFTHRQLPETFIKNLQANTFIETYGQILKILMKALCRSYFYFYFCLSILIFTHNYF